MHRSKLTLAMLLAPLALAPRLATAQVSVNLHLGNAVSISAYDQTTHGDWRTNYKKWQPTTMYAYNGQYYAHSTTGARAVVVYHSGSQYFLPPRDAAWSGTDKRYNLKHKPTDDDYNHAGPPHRP